MFLKLCAYVAASAFKKDNKMERTISYRCHQSPMFFWVSDQTTSVSDRWILECKGSVKSEWKYQKEKFLFGLFCSSERIFSFFVLLPGMAAVTRIPQALFVTYLWDVWIIWKSCLCHLKSSNEFCTIQTFFSFFNTFSRKLALVQVKNAPQPWIT